MTTISKEIKENALYRIDESTRMVSKCLGALKEQDIWKKPNGVSNSMGNLVVHLCGNIRQYIISSLGEQPDTRHRDLEFSITEGYDKEELLKMLVEVTQKAKEVIEAASDAQLLKVRNVQGFKLSGIGIILHVVEHYSYHTGQIAYWTKIVNNKDLGFYDEFDLNTKND
jgi:uncharacterized damage-inducible protein DinB